MDTGCVGSLSEAANAFVYNYADACADHTQAIQSNNSFRGHAMDIINAGDIAI